MTLTLLTFYPIVTSAGSAGTSKLSFCGPTEVAADRTYVYVKLPNECTGRLVWGHGHDVERSVLTFQRQPNSCIAGIGCFVDSVGNVPGQRSQPGNNGTFMGLLMAYSNGGMNPVLSHQAKKAREDHIKEATFADFEKAFLVREYGEKLVLEKTQEVNAVGFMRLVQHQWIATIREGIRQMQDGPCGSVRIQFGCPSSNLDNNKYRKRMELAHSTTVRSETEGGEIRFQERWCGDVTISEIELETEDLFSIPKACEEDRQISKQDAQTILEGSCRELFEKKNPEQPLPPDPPPHSGGGCSWVEL